MAHRLTRKVLWLSVLIAATSCPPVLAERKPNVVFFLVDDLGQRDVGCYGGMSASNQYRVPLVVHWPGRIEPNSTSDAIVTGTDYYPTLLEMLGLPPVPKQHVDGKSFVAALQGQTHDRGPIYWHFPHYSNHGYQSPNGAIRAGKYKLIEYFENGTVQLFDLENDIGERHDLSKQDPATTQKLKQQLHDWQKSVDAQMPPVKTEESRRKARERQRRGKRRKKPAASALRTTNAAPVIRVAAGLNKDGILVQNYKRGLQYATDYFGNYGPYYVYLLGPESEPSVREIFRQRATSRVNPKSRVPAARQIEEFLKRPNVVAEIKAVLAGKAEGGLTWTQEPPVLYEDVTTNATGREKDPIENTWGALHEYHHVFQMAHCDTTQPRNSDKHINSWIAEGMATYSSAKFMQNLGLVDFKQYMLDLRKNGESLSGRPFSQRIASSTTRSHAYPSSGSTRFPLRTKLRGLRWLGCALLAVANQ